MFGLDSLTGGGGLTNTSSAQSSAGPITVGGLTFAPRSQPDTVIIAGMVAVLALSAMILFRG